MITILSVYSEGEPCPDKLAVLHNAHHCLGMLLFLLFMSRNTPVRSWVMGKLKDKYRLFTEKTGQKAVPLSRGENREERALNNRINSCHSAVNQLISSEPGQPGDWHSPIPLSADRAPSYWAFQASYKKKEIRLHSWRSYSVCHFHFLDHGDSLSVSEIFRNSVGLVKYSHNPVTWLFQLSKICILTCESMYIICINQGVHNVLLLCGSLCLTTTTEVAIFPVSLIYM